ncbi:hypothetical protein FPV67DRAFT_1777310 [Lyophyllum atratum]|nr:hypothetical protein FPV67DRAFT_1777310 [Lyophyllum atratum]
MHSNIQSNQRSTSTTMFPPQLPLDVLDDIIDHLHNDPGSLSRCCLVCKALVILSRKRLFRVIYLNSRDGDSTDLPCKPFYNYLIANPRLVGYIHELWVKGKDRIIEDADFRALSTLFARGGSLRVFSINFSPKLSGYDDWCKIPIAFKDLLCNVLCSPSLNTLRIHVEDMCACTFPEDLLTAAPNVKQLTLLGKEAASCLAETHAWGTYSDAHGAQPNKTSKPLEILEIGGVDWKGWLELFGNPRSCHKLSGLRKLVVAEWTDLNFLSGLCTILPEAAANIETLVWLNPYFDNFILDYNLEQLINLRTLVFQVNLAKDGFWSLNQLLEETAVPCMVEKLAIIVEDNVYSPMFDTYANDSATARDIDRCLDDWFGRLEPLHTITIHVVFDALGDAENLGVDTDGGLRAHFPLLDATGKLSVSFGDGTTTAEILKALSA